MKRSAPWAGLAMLGALVATLVPLAAAASAPRGRLVLRGAMELVGADHVFEDAVENLGVLEVVLGSARFGGAVTNRGRIKITDSEVHFDGGYVGLGAYESDPSDQYFTDLVVGTTGYLVGGAGDRFFVNGDFISSSTMNTSWNTVDAYLEFRTGLDAQHAFHLTAADVGPWVDGYTHNFAWGTLHIASGNDVELLDGNATPGGALYVREITGAVLSGSDVTNISVTGAGPLHIYYQPAEPANAYLGSLIYDFAGNGQLIPIGAAAVPAGSRWSRAALGLVLLAAGLALSRLRGARPDGSLG